MEGAGDAGTLEVVGIVLLAAGHETGHLNLGNLNLLATIVGKGDVGNCKCARACVRLEREQRTWTLESIEYCESNKCDIAFLLVQCEESTSHRSSTSSTA